MCQVNLGKILEFALNLFWGMQFRRFGKSPQGTDSSPLSLCRFTKNYKSHTAITSIVDSALGAESSEKRIVRSTQTRPLRGAKNREQGRSSASADFLLEADKRGSPPKSEKRQLLARRGSGVGGCSPFAKRIK